MNSKFERVSRDPAFSELFALARRRYVSRNEVLIEEGSRASHLYLLVSGLMAVRYTGPRDAELLLAYLHPGDFFGEMCLFPGIEARSAMIKAAGDSAVLEIDYKPFVELTRRFPSMWLELAGQLAQRLRTTNHRLAAMPVLHVVDRIWLVIAEMARHAIPDEVSGDRVIRLSRKDLGKLAGCSRELAGMVLLDMAKTGRISLSGHSIIFPASTLASDTDVPGAFDQGSPET
ncbi:MAG: cyclic nucleotide-binding domain-containing protein [Panacagrimonas sp.]